MRFFVTLQNCQSQTIRGPFSGKRYTFKIGEKQEVNGRDFDFFKTDPKHYFLEVDGIQGGEATFSLAKKRTPLSHSTLSQLRNNRGKFIEPLVTAEARNRKIIEDAGKARAAYLLVQKQKAEAEQAKAAPLDPVIPNSGGKKASEFQIKAPVVEAPVVEAPVVEAVEATVPEKADKPKKKRGPKKGSKSKKA